MGYYTTSDVPFIPVECNRCHALVLQSSTTEHDRWHNQPCDAMSYRNDRCVRTGPHGSTEHLAAGPTGHAYIWQGTYSERK